MTNNQAHIEGHYAGPFRMSNTEGHFTGPRMRNYQASIEGHSRVFEELAQTNVVCF